MLDRVRQLISELDDIDALLGDPAVVADTDRLVALSKRRSELEPVVDAARRLAAVNDDMDAARAMFAESEGADRDLMRDELAELEAAEAAISAELKILLVPSDPNDDRNVIVEVRGAEGGEEANLFAAELVDMYRTFADRSGWRFEMLETSPSERGGVSEAIFLLRGDRVWSRMKFEAGPHRVQRVPVTESQGRVHTSSATVIVLPEAEEVDVAIDPNDLQIDVYRSSGPGGQSVNTTDSAVRITHKPSGVVVSMQDEKSQLQNREKAMRVLRSRLLQLERDRQTAEASGARRAQIGGGGRAEKIRTYNFKENRVTDHRIGLTLYRLDRILGGELDDVSDALVAAERAEQLAAHDV